MQVQRIQEVTFPHADDLAYPLKQHYDYVRRTFEGPQTPEIPRGHGVDDDDDDLADDDEPDEDGDHPDGGRPRLAHLKFPRPDGSRHSKSQKWSKRYFYNFKEV